ncbi:hypothetical protein FE633_17395 [Streptomyces montanus]|uniref:Uncharacterized protein n=1 Tax=Streptomyces montanus TaxID=2580423 RepID=A0A5R9FNL0_9ACTN|nr:hypothetical protein [Streptomyces montanus]TLS44921.1 hypothetical protein FE633_17395 [Streptomyces montanus]
MKISPDEAKTRAGRRHGNPRLFREVLDGGEVIGWTYVAGGNFATVRFGYITVEAEHPHETVDYRSYAEDHVRHLMEGQAP